MLVFSRKIGERVVINDNVVVTVLSVKGRGTRLGIVAPPAVRVDRAEVANSRRSATAKTAKR